MKLSEREIQELYQKMTGRDEAKKDCLDEDSLIRAATGMMNASEREHVVSHIASCSDCAREYQIARGLRPLRGDVPAAARFPLATAAMVVIAIGALIWMFAVQQRNTRTIADLQRQLAVRVGPPPPAAVPTTIDQKAAEGGGPTLQIGTPIVDLDADVRRGAPDVPSITLPAASDVMTLILHLPDGMKGPMDLDLDGGAATRIEPVSETVTITLAASPGAHTVRVKSGKRIVNFHFNVQR